LECPGRAQPSLAAARDIRTFHPTSLTGFEPTSVPLRHLVAATVAGSLALAGCGGSGTEPATQVTTTGPAAGQAPAGAVAPTNTAERAAEGPAATEASPGEPPRGPAASGSLSPADQAAVGSAVAAYITALDRHDATGVCALLAPGSLPPRQLPRQASGCRDSLRASIGVRPRNGGPAWRRSSLVEVRVERIGRDRARVSATVTHHFSDRKYVSVEDDVIYLERRGGRWLLAQPSGTLYRAVGYPQPPLRAFEPPADW